MRAALLLLLALVGLAVGTSEVRNIHQDLTAVSGGVSLEGNREHFFVEVDRIEKELSDDGILLEERDISVALFYDIAEDSSLLVNKVPVPSGFSNIKVEALVRETRSGSEELLEAIKEISVRLFVKREEVLLNTGKTAQHIIIQERVTGIQDTEVWQAEVVEQALVILEDGSVQRLEAVKVNAMFGESRPDIDTPLVDPLPESPVVDPLPNTGTGRPLPQTKPYYHPGHHGKPHHGHGHGHGKPHHGKPHHGKPHHEEEQGEGEGEGATFDGHVGPSEVEEEVHRCLQTVKHYLHEGMHWFHGLPFYLRVLVSFGAGMAAGLLGIGMARCLFGLFNLCCCASSGSKKRQQEEEARKRREEYLRNIKEYSLQYTALPQDEKKEKKEAEQVPLMQV